MLLPYSDNKKLKPTDVLSFPWEEESVLEAIPKPKSREELENHFKQLEEKINH